MSNVGATVLLVPLAVNIAIGVGADPGVCSNGCTGHVQFVPDSNAQVNALIMGPGGYRVPDFMRAGGIMTIIFLVVLIGMMNLIY